MADTRDLKSGGSICPPNLKSPVKSSVFQFSFPESIAQFSPEFSPVWNLQFSYAAVLESVDKADLKSARILLLYGFESRQRHHSEMTFGCQMTAQARPSRQQRSFFVQPRDRFAGLRGCAPSLLFIKRTAAAPLGAAAALCLKAAVTRFRFPYPARRGN